ncbi:hypothetical protein [Brevibacillus sp. MS2.2]|uniref:hypothetical protein n=1 Tax=Brevibacillus sp. MS2.2 TaxID=2738981 RepID=UPI00156AEEDE|nr:hypothetical protein [Brevibacillus sp. MS2.2]NRR20611.1 hypothetical protein [Brevibacillus sp. MS2.2]
MIKKLITLGAVVSALTFGSQAAFASDIKQTQNQTLQLNQGQSKVQVENQSQDDAFYWFHLSRLDSIASSGTFTIDSKTSVKVVAFTGSVNPGTPAFIDAKVTIVTPYGDNFHMSLYGNQYKEGYFVLEPGSYYLKCTNYAGRPIFMNVNLYKN